MEETQASISLRVIGRVRTPFMGQTGTPVQPAYAEGVEGQVVIDERFAEALNGSVTVATDAILESISDGVFTVDEDWRVMSFNRSAELITGISREEAIGRRCSDVFRASMCETECALRHTMESGGAVVNKATFIINSAGKRIPISVSTALLRDEHGTVVGGAETFRDLSIIEELRTQVRGRFQVGDIVSRSTSMRRLLELPPLRRRLMVPRELGGRHWKVGTPKLRRSPSTRKTEQTMPRKLREISK